MRIVTVNTLHKQMKDQDTQNKISGIWIGHLYRTHVFNPRGRADVLVLLGLLPALQTTNTKTQARV